MRLVARRAEEAHQSCYLAPCRVLLLPSAARSPSEWWCMEVISTWPEPSCRSLISSSLLWGFATGAMLLQPRLSGIVTSHYRWMDGPKMSGTLIFQFWLNWPHYAQSHVKKRAWKASTSPCEPHSVCWTSLIQMCLNGSIAAVFKVKKSSWGISPKAPFSRCSRAFHHIIRYWVVSNLKN